MTRKLSVVFLAICLVLGLTQAAPAIVLDSIAGPIVTLTVGTETLEAPMILGEKGWLLPTVNFTTAAGSLALNMATDISPVDPIIAWGLTATNFAAVPVAFGFGVVIPIALPVGSPTVIDASVVGGMTDLLGDGVSVTPTSITGFLQDNTLASAGFTWSAGPAVAFGAGLPGALYPYGPFAFGPAAGPLGAGADFLIDGVGFLLSPSGDIASLTGFCSIVPIPVPPSACLFGTGLLGLLGFGWRRMKG
ncbi:MAG: hypothetical protein WC600_17430 [Desulfobaccales bacterium]